MSRELKFRAWDKKRKRMYKVLHLHMETDLWCTVQGFDVILDKEIHLSIQPNDVSIQQYTGIKDKHGNEIYESDIVKMNVDICVGHPWGETFSLSGYHQGEVILHRRFGVCLGDYFTMNDDTGEVTKGKYKTISSYRAEVIGNVHKNPELLTPKTEHDGQTND
jgi:uncharacterized phage protein (TIGR01671 family)